MGDPSGTGRLVPRRLDRALRLYRGRQLNAEAGDLLRRLGEEDDAVAEYALAAEILSADPRRDHLAAGDLLSDRARRPDLALPLYAKGWLARSSANAVACALRMARLLVDGKATAPLLALVDEADGWFARPGPVAEANEFYNDLADSPHALCASMGPHSHRPGPPTPAPPDLRRRLRDRHRRLPRPRLGRLIPGVR